MTLSKQLIWICLTVEILKQYRNTFERDLILTKGRWHINHLALYMDLILTKTLEIKSFSTIQGFNPYQDIGN